jgi:tape measure domain-containing protein
MSANTVNFDLEIAVKGFQQSLDQANASVKEFSADFKKNTGGNTQAWNSFVGSLGAKGVELALTGIKDLASSIGNLGVQAVKNAGELEMMSVELGVMLGSAEAGEAQLKKLQAFAATSPFQLPGIVEANKLLLGFGTTAAEIPEVLEVLGNIAAGSGKPLSDLARIFGQVQAETKLSLERLNQLNDAGVNLGPTLANKLGIPLKDVRKAVTDGKVSFDLFRETMVKIQAEGGVYAGGMIKQSQTLQGVLSSLSDNFFNLSGELGKTVLPMFKSIALALIEFTDAIVKNMDNIKIAIQTIGILTAAYGAYLLVTNLATIATTGLATAIAILTSPITLTIAAIVAVGAAVFALIKYWDEVKLAFLTGVQVILQTIQPLEAMFNKLFGMDTSMITSSLESIGQSIDKVKEKINQKQQPIVDQAALDAEAKAAEELAAKKAAALAEKIAAEKAANAIILENKRIHNGEMLLAEQEAIVAENEFHTANDTLNLETQIVKQQEDLLRRQEFEQAKLQLQIDAEMQKAKLTTDSIERKKAIEEAANKAELARLNLSNKQKLDTMKLTASQSKAIQADELKDREMFFSTAITLQQSGNKAAAAIGKAAALTQLAIKTPEAVASSFAFGTRTGGPVLGAVLGGIAAAAMAAQAARIAGVGNFADGGFIPGNSFAGDRLQANVNSGEAVLNASQQKEFMRIANGGGSANDALLTRLDSLEAAILNRPVVLLADDSEIARSVSRGVQNGIEIGRSR